MWLLSTSTVDKTYYCLQYGRVSATQPGEATLVMISEKARVTTEGYLGNEVVQRSRMTGVASNELAQRR